MRKAELDAFVHGFARKLVLNLRTCGLQLPSDRRHWILFYRAPSYLMSSTTASFLEPVLFICPEVLNGCIMRLFLVARACTNARAGKYYLSAPTFTQIRALLTSGWK